MINKNVTNVPVEHNKAERSCFGGKWFLTASVAVSGLAAKLLHNTLVATTPKSVLDRVLANDPWHTYKVVAIVAAAIEAVLLFSYGIYSCCKGKKNDNELLQVEGLATDNEKEQTVDEDNAHNNNNALTEEKDNGVKVLSAEESKQEMIANENEGDSEKEVIIKKNAKNPEKDLGKQDQENSPPNKQLQSTRKTPSRVNIDFINGLASKNRRKTLKVKPYKGRALRPMPQNSTTQKNEVRAARVSAKPQRKNFRNVFASRNVPDKTSIEPKKSKIPYSLRRKTSGSKNNPVALSPSPFRIKLGTPREVRSISRGMAIIPKVVPDFIKRVPRIAFTPELKAGDTRVDMARARINITVPKAILQKIQNEEAANDSDSFNLSGYLNENTFIDSDDGTDPTMYINNFEYNQMLKETSELDKTLNNLDKRVQEITAKRQLEFARPIFSPDNELDTSSEEL